MTEKHNDATHNRPAGARTIDAPSVAVDLSAFVNQIRQEDAWKKSDRNSITVFKTDDMRIVLGGLHKGAELLTHVAEGIMSIQVLEGMLDIKVDNNVATLQQGHMIAIHKGCKYKVMAAEESIYLLTMSAVN